MPPTHSAESRIDIFHGPATEHRATLYARWHVDNREGMCHIRGSVSGPQCRFASTLPATFELIDQPAGPTVLAAAPLIDPCGWSLDLPALYQVELELWQGEAVVGRVHRMTGVRRFAVRGNSFALNGQRCVLRMGQAPVPNLESWREIRLTRLISGSLVDDALCREASELGVALVVDMSQYAGDIGELLRRVAKWPAVIAAILPAGKLRAEWKNAAPNMIWGVHVQRADSGGDVVMADSLGDFVFASHELCRSLAEQYGGPLMAYWVADAADLVELRRQCDELQASLTPLSLAGYAVMSADSRPS